MEVSTEAPEGLLPANRPPRVQSPSPPNLSSCHSLQSFNRLSIHTVVSTSASLIRGANSSSCASTCIHNMRANVECICFNHKSPVDWYTVKRGEKGPPPLFPEHYWDPSPHDSWLAILLALAFVHFKNSENSKRWKKKSEGKKLHICHFRLFTFFTANWFLHLLLLEAFWARLPGLSGFSLDCQARLRALWPGSREDF